MHLKTRDLLARNWQSEANLSFSRSRCVLRQSGTTVAALECFACSAQRTRLSSFPNISMRTPRNILGLFVSFFLQVLGLALIQRFNRETDLAGVLSHGHAQRVLRQL
jgi:hypothetical protein